MSEPNHHIHTFNLKVYSHRYYPDNVDPDQFGVIKVLGCRCGKTIQESVIKTVHKHSPIPSNHVEKPQYHSFGLVIKDNRRNPKPDSLDRLFRH